MRLLSAFLLRPLCTRPSRLSSLEYSARLLELSAGLSYLPESFPQNTSGTPTHGNMGHTHGRSQLRSTDSKDGSRRKVVTKYDPSHTATSPDNSTVKPNYREYSDRLVQLSPKGEPNRRSSCAAVAPSPEIRSEQPPRTEPVNRLGDSGTHHAVFRTR